MNDAELPERARHLLAALTRQYIESGRPVGSKVLSDRSGLKLSPATIRSVMAELEHLGYIASPHTSAGRIPTELGYRFFVETLLTTDATEKRVAREISRRLSEPAPVSEKMTEVSETLSALTNFVGVVTVPRRELLAFQKIEFLPLDNQQILAIVVLGGGEVQNRVLKLDRETSPADLERAARMLNAEYSGMPFREIKSRLVGDLVTARREMDQVMETAIELAKSAIGRSAQVVLSGQNKLIGYDDLSDVGKLKGLFEAFQRKREVLDLLERCEQAGGVKLFIGNESGSDALEPCSIVGAPYRVDGEVVGVLGVIGPTRMEYERVISVVDSTAKILGSVLDGNS